MEFCHRFSVWEYSGLEGSPKNLHYVLSLVNIFGMKSLHLMIYQMEFQILSLVIIK